MNADLASLRQTFETKSRKWRLGLLIRNALEGFGGVFMAVVGVWWLPGVPVALCAAIGMTIVALGIAGDLFESMLKLSAGVKEVGIFRVW